MVKIHIYFYHRDLIEIFNIMRNDRKLREIQNYSTFHGGIKINFYQLIYILFNK